MGVLLTGMGQIWFDHADFQEVDHNTRGKGYKEKGKNPYLSSLSLFFIYMI
ncbi:hypothetical protein [Paenibacillus oralis]|uniref:hypothetical protein n=1 Tax=Paenibacillus oralis TaxID=2490856 RepID=UPI0015AFC67C|nr:hypothetical protein [Paenibacillus oralis]